MVWGLLDSCEIGDPIYVEEILVGYCTKATINIFRDLFVM